MSKPINSRKSPEKEVPSLIQLNDRALLIFRRGLRPTHAPHAPSVIFHQLFNQFHNVLRIIDIFQLESVGCPPSPNENGAIAQQALQPILMQVDVRHEAQRAEIHVRLKLADDAQHDDQLFRRDNIANQLAGDLGIRHAQKSKAKDKRAKSGRDGNPFNSQDAQSDQQEEAAAIFNEKCFAGTPQHNDNIFLFFHKMV